MDKRDMQRYAEIISMEISISDECDQMSSLEMAYHLISIAEQNDKYRYSGNYKEFIDKNKSRIAFLMDRLIELFRQKFIKSPELFNINSKLEEQRYEFRNTLYEWISSTIPGAPDFTELRKGIPYDNDKIYDSILETYRESENYKYQEANEKEEVEEVGKWI